MQGKINSELLHELSDCFDIYLFLQEKINNNRKKINQILQEQTQDIVLPEDLKLVNKKGGRKNQVKLDLQSHCYKIFGVDLFAIECISEGTIASFLAEVGSDIYKFKTAKQFVSWLRLAPNNRIMWWKNIKQ